ncbi:MAG: FAD/NAD(P)-binding protein [Candidatus Brocadiae bacterium]|nr:FAD/NAD(P)-binding protein [Candidatus Brocadiia bacterium]
METRADAGVLAPEFLRVTGRRKELADTWTLELEPRAEFPFRPGQFNMVYVFGFGEVAISISGDPAAPGKLVHTVRAVGKLTTALCASKAGAQLGIRGPFGTSWPVDEAAGGDVVLVAGGLGLAPLRPAVYRILAEREKFGRVTLLYGARSPETVLYRAELRRWARAGIDVRVTVDAADARWRGNVGVVTRLIDQAAVTAGATAAFVCGPEIMMRFAVSSLTQRGIPTDRISVSMERNMKCAVGFCGHCQYGPEFICRDGPVFPFRRIEHLFRIREL